MRCVIIGSMDCANQLPLPRLQTDFGYESGYVNSAVIITVVVVVITILTIIIYNFIHHEW